MNLTITLVSAGATKKNARGALSVSSVEELSAKSQKELNKKMRSMNYPPVDQVYAGPETYCAQTAQIIYPESLIAIRDKLKSYDYGDFAGLTAIEIKNNKQFAQWAMSETIQPFPGGESYHVFSSKIGAEFERIAVGAIEIGLSSIGIVAHGMNISVIMKKIHTPRILYTDWSVKSEDRIVIKYDSRTNTGYLEKNI